MTVRGRTLAFKGRISPGAGRHSEMSIPGRESLADSPPDWPERLCPGSLNVLVEVYPEGFTEPAGRSGGAYQLDDGTFRPAFLVPGDLITENKLVHDGKPAAAQVWRARLRIEDRGDTIPCWVLRRFGSNVGKGKGGNVLEIVSDAYLRKAHDLRDGQAVVLALLEGPAAA